MVSAYFSFDIAGLLLDGHHNSLTDYILLFMKIMTQIYTKNRLNQIL